MLPTLILAALVVGQGQRTTKPEPKPKAPNWVALSVETTDAKPGDVLILFAEEPERPVFFAHDYDRDDYRKFSRARDTDGIAELTAKGAIGFVPSGTIIRYVKRHDDLAEVRIMNGTHKGKLVYASHNDCRMAVDRAEWEREMKSRREQEAARAILARERQERKEALQAAMDKAEEAASNAGSTASGDRRDRIVNRELQKKLEQIAKDFGFADVREMRKAVEQD